jgi:chloramphenicol-sensitive protein RarD
MNFVTFEAMAQELTSRSESDPAPALNWGLIAGITAYTIWGFFPFYFKATVAAGAVEILAHRILWSVPFGFILIALRSQWGDLLKGLRNPRLLGWLVVSSSVVALNWGVYIWAVQIGEIYQASLGYYINPLVLVVAGMIFFGEKLSRLKLFAVLLATCGVAALAVYGGVFPWISLILAVSFAIYGVVRKRVDIGAIPGLMIETLILLAPAAGYLLILAQRGDAVFGGADNTLTILLVMAGPLTVLPLLCFAVAAKKLQLATVGILQFIAPTLHFGCALYFGEVFTTAHAICFSCIWTAVALFSWDALRQRKKQMVAV